MIAIAWPGLIVDAPAQAENQREKVEAWIEQILKQLFRGGPALEPGPKPAPPLPSPGVLRLTLDQAMALFLKQNLDLIMANYGIDAAKGRQITARLYPNPTLAVNTFSSYTQGCDIQRCGAVAPTLTQLFEVAGRRGYRMDAAASDTLSVEARFEDTVRQLGFTLKDTYFRVQRHRRHLAVDQEVQGTLIKLLQGLAGEGKRGVSELDRVRLGLLAVNADTEVLRDMQRIEEVSGDLRMMLRVSPDVELDLETDLSYRPVEPNLSRLLEYALENRPDIRAKRLVRDRRKTELQLARADPVPQRDGRSRLYDAGTARSRQPTTVDLQPLCSAAGVQPESGRDRGGGGGRQDGGSGHRQNGDPDSKRGHGNLPEFLHSRKLVDATNGALTHASTLFRAAQQGYGQERDRDLGSGEYPPRLRGHGGELSGCGVRLPAELAPSRVGGRA